MFNNLVSTYFRFIYSFREIMKLIVIVIISFWWCWSSVLIFISSRFWWLIVCVIVVFFIWWVLICDLFVFIVDFCTFLIRVNVVMITQSWWLTWQCLDLAMDLTCYSVYYTFSYLIYLLNEYLLILLIIVFAIL